MKLVIPQAKRSHRRALAVLAHLSAAESGTRTRL
jgi:hypothetical protein